jgi:hypothetical protein
MSNIVFQMRYFERFILLWKEKKRERSLGQMPTAEKESQLQLIN